MINETNIKFHDSDILKKAREAGITKCSVEKKPLTIKTPEKEEELTTVRSI